MRKRTAADSVKEPAAKQARKKQVEVVVKPDLDVVTKGGKVYTAGQGDVGQLGLGEDVMEKSRFTPLPDLENIIAIAAGGMHSVCLTSDGKVLTFGCNDESALGRDTSKEGSEFTPSYVELPGKAVQISAGDSHSAALLDDGRVFAWGSFRDSHGSMGLSPKGSEKTPIQLVQNVKFAKIASGDDHLVMLTESGQLYTCGCGELGQLGRITCRSVDRYARRGIKSLLTPELVAIKRNKKVCIDNVWAGCFATYAKAADSQDIYVFGLNNYYQIGLPKPDPCFFPQISQQLSGKSWKKIISGQHHSIALDQEGKVYVLGRKEYGRLGLGEDCTDAVELTIVPSLQSLNCVDIAAGTSSSYAVTSAGDVYAWGMGTDGQLGNGKEEDLMAPGLVEGKQIKLAHAVKVSGGGQHTVVLGITRQAKEKAAG